MTENQQTRDAPPKNPGGASTKRKTDRIEAFSDAVLAIAITLPVLDLKAPQVKLGGDLSGGYSELNSQYFSYSLSFLVIGLYWAHSHFSGKIIKKTDHGFNLLTLLFLAAVSITPFPTRPFLEHWNDAATCRLAASVYAGLLAAPSVFWLARWLYAVGHDLLDPHLEPVYVRRLSRKYALTTALLLAGWALTCWANWPLGLGLCALVTLSYLWPPITPEFKAGEEPGDELEEADEA